MEIQQAIEWQKAFKRTYKGQPKEVDEACDLTIAALEEIQQYRSIGTVEECQKARERQIGKKVKARKLLRDFQNIPYSIRGNCPNCDSIGLLSTNTDYCNACGQKLDWSDAD